MDNKEIIRLINEWKRGCSDATPEAPELCPQCTRGLIDAIEHKANQSNTDEKYAKVLEGMFKDDMRKMDAIRCLELSGQPITSSAIDAIANRFKTIL